jgi:hypothetical protein
MLYEGTGDKTALRIEAVRRSGDWRRRRELPRRVSVTEHRKATRQDRKKDALPDIDRHVFCLLTKNCLRRQ